MNEYDALAVYVMKVSERMSKPARENIISSFENLNQYSDTVRQYFDRGISVERAIELLDPIWERPDSDFEFVRGTGARPPADGG